MKTTALLNLNYIMLFSGFRDQILSGSLIMLEWPILRSMAHAPSFLFVLCP